ncbi:MAG: tryptophan synthase subunit alpha [Melioribacteraceae bacterium]|nr:MAG: tryptophan synthase subunit alpha [Melioribacteraceae bacterium]
MIRETIEKINDNNQKALSIYLTAGYPKVDSFVDLVCKVYEAGADLIELGIPFSDPLADGPVIQKSSEAALSNGVSISSVLEMTSKIKERVDKPLILMGYANPILHYGIENFINDAKEAKVDGLIIPDIPLEEYEDFFKNKFKDFEIIMLTTPTSSEERIKKIDELSTGFVYCVSVTGTTGVRNNFGDEVKHNLERTYNIISKNKMMLGFGISSPQNIKEFREYTDGFIVGSAVVKSLSENDNNYSETLDLITNLSIACKS